MKEAEDNYIANEMGDTLRNEFFELLITQQQLEESRDYYADYFDFAPITLITFNEKGVIIDLNLTGAEMLQTEKSHLINLSLINFVVKKDHKKFYDHFKECKAGHTKVSTELTLKLQNKNLIHIELRTIPTQDYINKKTIYRSAIVDITERKKYEEKISKLAAIVDSSDDAIISTDLDAIITTWNEGAKIIFGYTKDEIIGKSIDMFIPEDRKAELELNYSKIKKGERIEHFETTRIRKDGERVNVSKSMFPVYNDEGVLTGVSIISRNITAQKIAQEAERESNKRFRQLAENINAVFFITDTEAKRIIYVSPAYKDVFEIEPEELIDNPNLGRELIHPDDKERILKKMDERSITFKFDEEFRIITKNGKIKWIHSQSFPVKDKSGKVYRIAGIAEDISRSKKAEEQLEKSELRFRKAVANFPDIFVIYNSEEKIAFINKSGLKLLGLKEKEILNHKDEEILPAEITNLYLPVLKQCTRKKILQTTECTFNINDEKFVFEIKFVPLLDEEENILQVLGIFHNITDRKEKERLIQASLDEKETLIKETHHRVKNNLQVIYSLLSLQSHEIKDEATKAIFIQSQHRVRAMSLIHDKLHYHSSLGGVMFKEYVEDLVNIIFNTYEYNNENLKLEIKIDDVHPDTDLIISIGLIINEIITNSIKYAFPENRSGKIYLHIVKINDKKFEIILGDDGVGIPEGLNFQNTTTLGLQVVNSLVTQHNGKIEICNKKGTEYKFIFEDEE